MVAQSLVKAMRRANKKVRRDYCEFGLPSDPVGLIGVEMMDQHLKRVYEEFDVPSDRIAQRSDHREEFIARIRASTDIELDDDAIIDRLIYLRKQGQLPRLRR